MLIPKFPVDVHVHLHRRRKRTSDAEQWSFQKWMQYVEAELVRLHGLDPSDLNYDWRGAHARGVTVREAVDRAAMGARDKARDEGYVVNRIGRYEIIEGIGPDGGDWFAKGRGERKRFKSKREAEEHAQASADDKTRDAGETAIVRQAGYQWVIQVGDRIVAGDLPTYEAAVQYARQLGYKTSDASDLEPGTELKRGDKIRENRQGAPVEEVLSAYENMVETYQGRRYHVTKIVRA